MIEEEFDEFLGIAGTVPNVSNIKIIDDLMDALHSFEMNLYPENKSDKVKVYLSKEYYKILVPTWINNKVDLNLEVKIASKWYLLGKNIRVIKKDKDVFIR